MDRCPVFLFLMFQMRRHELSATNERIKSFVCKQENMNDSPIMNGKKQAEVLRKGKPGQKLQKRQAGIAPRSGEKSRGIVEKQAIAHFQPINEQKKEQYLGEMEIRGFLISGGCAQNRGVPYISCRGYCYYDSGISLTTSIPLRAM